MTLTIKCNPQVQYSITSALTDAPSTEKLISLKINDATNDPSKYLFFDDFSCEPSDCCKLEYSVLSDEGDINSVVASTEAVIGVDGTGQRYLNVVRRG